MTPPYLAKSATAVAGRSASKIFARDLPAPITARIWLAAPFDRRRHIQMMNRNGSSRISQDKTCEPNDGPGVDAVICTLAACSRSSRPDRASCTGMTVV